MFSKIQEFQSNERKFRRIEDRTLKIIIILLFLNINLSFALNVSFGVIPPLNILSSLSIIIFLDIVLLILSFFIKNPTYFQFFIEDEGVWSRNYNRGDLEAKLRINLEA